jgi:hypothetical protein
MTTAKIKSKLPADGHGLNHRLADSYFQARAKGEPSEDLIVVGRLSSIGHGEEKGKPWVSFEFAALEVVAEDWERANVRDILTNASEKRHGGAQLSMDFEKRSPDEQRRELLTYVDEWAAEQDPPLTAGDVAERWRTHWSIGEGEPESPDGAFPNPNIDKAAPHHIREFALMVGAIADESPADGDDADADDEVDGKTRAAGE